AFDPVEFGFHPGDGHCVRDGSSTAGELLRIDPLELRSCSSQSALSLFFGERFFFFVSAVMIYRLVIFLCFLFSYAVQYKNQISCSLQPSNLSNNYIAFKMERIRKAAM
ncbi:unnamed protein product, partial [Urochloa humidicola]